MPPHWWNEIGYFLDDQPEPSNEILCEKCRSINFAKIIDSFESDKDVIGDSSWWDHGVDICSLGYVQKVSTCPLCNFFWTMGNFQEQDGVLKPVLCAVSSRHDVSNLANLRTSKYRWFTNVQNTVLFHISSAQSSTSYYSLAKNKIGERYGGGEWHSYGAGRFFTVINETARSRRGYECFKIEDTSGAINWLNVKSCIQKCQESHAICNSLADRDFSGLVLQVIDCNSRKIVDLPQSAEYVTLSYVWGPSNQSQDLETAPPTISDAIVATTSLGYSYLWVDRYCISDNNRHALIQQMGRIYKFSSLTIIAAAGDGPTFGLPGISGPRDCIPCLTVGSLVFCPHFTNVRQEILASKWNQRGWTFQEALLSRRRLIFTKTQLFYQCQAVSNYESMSFFAPSPSSGLSLFDPERQTLLNTIEDSIEPILPKEGIGSSFNEIYSRVSEYSQKNLTYETDTLQAFQGIFQEFKTRYGEYFVEMYGLVISTTDSLQSFTPLQPKIGQAAPFISQALITALLWTHDGASVSTRHSSMPSWSWAGWARDAGKFYPEEQSYESDYSVEISVQFPDGQLLYWDTQWKEILKRTENDVLEQKKAPLLRLKGLVFDLGMPQFDKLTAGDEKKVRDELSSESTFSPLFPLGNLMRFRNLNGNYEVPLQVALQGYCRAILMTVITGDMSRVSVLLVREIDKTGHFERFGVGHWSFYHKSGQMDMIKLVDEIKKDFDVTEDVIVLV